MASEVGSGQVAVFPTFKGFRKQVDAEVTGSAKGAGQNFARAFNSSAGRLGTTAVSSLKKNIATASRALSAARLKEQDAAGRVRVAEVRLAEARAKSGAQSARSVAAEERLASAQRTLAAAQTRTKTASTQLTTAQRALSSAQTDAGAKGQQSANRFASAWRTLGSKITAGLRSSMSQAGATATPAASSAGRRAGTSFSTAFASTARRAGRGLAGFGRSILAGLGLGAIGATIAMGITSSIRKGFGRLVSIDTAKTKLQGLGNSAKQTDAIMADALKSVKGTAFGLDEAATVAASAVAAGIKPGQELQKTLGLVASAATVGGTSMANMGSIFNKVATSNKAQNDSLQQLSDKGIPIYQSLAKVMGVSAGEVSKLASKGKIDFATFQKAMQDAVGDSAKVAGQSFAGVVANMGAAANRLGAAVLGGVFPHLAPMFSDITNKLDAWAPAATKVGDSLGKGFAKGYEALKKISGAVRLFFGSFSGKGADVDLGKWMNPIIDAGSKARGIFDGFKTIFAPLIPAIVAFGKAFADLGPQVSPMAVIFKGLAPILPQLAQAISGLLLSALQALLPLFTSLAGLMTGTVVPIITQLAQAAMPLLAAAIGVVSAVLPPIAQLLGAIIPIIAQLAMALLPALVAVFAAVTPIISALTPVISVLINVLAAILVPVLKLVAKVVQVVFTLVAALIVQTMKNAQIVITAFTKLLQVNWSGAWNKVKQITSAAVGAVVGFFTSLYGKGVSLFSRLVSTVVGFFTSLWSRARSTVSGMVSSVVGLFNSLVSRAASAVFGLVGRVSSAMGQVNSAISSKVSAAVGIVTGLPGRLVSAIASGAGRLYDAGFHLISMLAQGITAALGKAVAAARGIADKIKGLFGGSPVEYGPLLGWNNGRVGRNLGGMLAKGLADSERDVGSAAERLAARIAGTTTAGWAGVSGGRGGASVYAPIEVHTPNPAVAAAVISNRLVWSL